MTAEPVVTFQTLRRMGWCAAGVRNWCDRNRFDMRRFREGVPVSELREMKCPLADKAIAAAEREH